MSVNFLPKTKGVFLHDFTLIASVVGESVKGMVNEFVYMNSYVANSYIRIHSSRQGKTLE